MSDDRFEQILRNFMATDMRGVQIKGINTIVAELLEEIVKEKNLPIEVLEKRNVIYFKRTDLQ